MKKMNRVIAALVVALTSAACEEDCGGGPSGPTPVASPTPTPAPQNAAPQRPGSGDGFRFDKSRNDFSEYACVGGVAPKNFPIAPKNPFTVIATVGATLPGNWRVMCAVNHTKYVTCDPISGRAINEKAATWSPQTFSAVGTVITATYDMSWGACGSFQPDCAVLNEKGEIVAVIHGEVVTTGEECQGGPPPTTPPTTTPQPNVCAGVGTPSFDFVPTRNEADKTTTIASTLTYPGGFTGSIAIAPAPASGYVGGPATSGQTYNSLYHNPSTGQSAYDVTGSWQVVKGSEVCASGSKKATVNPQPPSYGVKVEKSVTPPSCAPRGGTVDVTFNITVTNTGNVTENIKVDDANAPDCSRSSVTVEAGKSVSYACSGKYSSGQHTNSVVATVLGIPEAVTGNDSVSFKVDECAPPVTTCAQVPFNLTLKYWEPSDNEARVFATLNKWPKDLPGVPDKAVVNFFDVPTNDRTYDWGDDGIPDGGWELNRRSDAGTKRVSARLVLASGEVCRDSETFTVNPPPAPTCPTLTRFDVNGGERRVDAVAELSAPIAKLELQLKKEDGTLVGTVFVTNASKIQKSWTGIAAGKYKVFVIATDAAGKQCFCESKSVTVTEPLTCDSQNPPLFGPNGPGGSPGNVRQVGSRVDVKVFYKARNYPGKRPGILWRNGGSIYVKAWDDVDLKCENGLITGTITWDSPSPSHMPSNGAKYWLFLWGNNDRNNPTIEAEFPIPLQ